MRSKLLGATCAGMFLCVVAASGTASAQNKIGLQFVGGGGSNTTQALKAAEKAGVPAVAQTNWNALQNASGTKDALNTDDGIASAVSVTWACPATWGSNADGTKGGDYALMAGYLDSTEATDDASIPVVTVKGLTWDKYDVYVYVNGDSPGENRQGSYAIGATAIKLKDSADFAGTYKQATAADPAGDYVEFVGLTGSTFTLKGTPSDSDGTKRAPINAVQIVKE